MPGEGREVRRCPRRGGARFDLLRYSSLVTNDRSLVLLSWTARVKSLFPILPESRRLPFLKLVTRCINADETSSVYSQESSHG